MARNLRGVALSALCIAAVVLASSLVSVPVDSNVFGSDGLSTSVAIQSGNGSQGQGTGSQSPGGSSASDSTSGDTPTDATPANRSAARGSQLGLLGSQQRTRLGGPISPGEPQVLFTVESPRAAYWRTTAYQRYTGTGWERGASEERLAPTGRADAATLTQRVTVRRPFAGGRLPAAWRPVSISSDVTDGTVRQAGTVTTTDPLAANESYTVVSRVSTPGPATLRAADGPTPPRVQERYTQLPADTPGRVGELTASITEGATTRYDRAAAVESWLEAEKTYSLNVSRPDEQFVDTFLFEMDRGYCQYFAASMVVMLRTQDIPARYVTGFSPGQAAGEDRYVVRSMNAHAWVEVYVPGEGWVQFDPTPASERLDSERQTLTERRARGGAATDTAGTANRSYDHSEFGSPGDLGNGTSTSGGSGSGAGSDSGSGAGTGPGSGDGAGTGSGTGTGSGDGTGPGDAGAGGSGDASGTGSGSQRGDGGGEGSGAGELQSRIGTGGSGGTPGTGSGPGSESGGTGSLRGADGSGEQSGSAGEGATRESGGESGDGQSDSGSAASGGQSGESGSDQSGDTSSEDESSDTGTDSGGESGGQSGSESSGSDTGSETEGGNGRDDGAADDQSAYNISVAGDVVPGAPITVTVTRGGTPRPGVPVAFNNETVGRTNESGQLTARVPLVRELVVSIARDDAEGATRTAGSGALLAGGGVSEAGLQRRAQGNESVRLDVETNVTISTAGPVLPGETVTLTASIRNYTVGNATVRVDGRYVGRTNASGQMALPIPYTESLSVTVSRGIVNGSTTLSVPTLDVAATSAVPGTTGRLDVTVGNRSVTRATVAVDGERVGETNESGQVAVAVPYRRNLTVTVSKGELRTNRTLDLPDEMNVTTRGFVLPGLSVTATARLAGRPVPNATVTGGGDEVGETSAAGVAPVSLPFVNTYEVTVVRGGVRGSTTVTNVLLLPLLLTGGLVLVVVTTVANRVFGVGPAPRSLLARARVLVARVGRATVARLVALTARLAAGIDRLSQFVRGLVTDTVATLRTVPGVVRGYRERVAARVGAWAASVQTRLGRVRARLARLRTRIGEESLGGLLWALLQGAITRLRPDGDSTADHGGRTGEATTTPRIAVERAWAELVGPLPVGDPTTTTAAQFRQVAIEQGLPAEAVVTLTRLYRETEYSHREASADAEATAWDALEAIRAARSGGTEPRGMDSRTEATA